MSVGSAIGSAIGSAAGSAAGAASLAPLIDPATLYTGGKKGIWIKPRDWSTLRQSYLGTGAVTVATDPVGYAADQSGNAKHMVNASAPGRPLAITVGSVNAIDFDGSDDKLATGSFTAGTWTTMDFFIAIYLDAAAQYVLADDDAGRFFGIGSNGSASSTVINAGSPSYKINGIAVPGGTASTRDQLYDATTFGSWIVIEANGLDLSAWAKAQFGNYPAYQINGKVAEVIVCESVSDAVRAQVRTYLGSHVGLTL